MVVTFYSLILSAKLNFGLCPDTFLCGGRKEQPLSEHLKQSHRPAGDLGEGMTEPLWHIDDSIHTTILEGIMPASVDDTVLANTVFPFPT